MIVVTTPTGQVGSQLLDHLLGAGQDVRVVVRDPARLAPRAREEADVVAGSHHDEAVVQTAFTGADTVFWLVPPNPRAGDVTGYYLDFTRAAATAIIDQGVRRVVAVTSLGHGWPKGAGNLSAAFAMDDLLQGTGVAYRALAMPYYLENLLAQARTIADQGLIVMPNAADRPLATVATADIAAVAAEVLLDTTWTGQEVVPVVGPDALTPTGMAEVVTEVLGSPVRYQQVPGEQYRSTMVGYGLSEAWARGLVDMATAQDEGIYDAAAATPRPGWTRTTPTSLRAWYEQHLVPAVASA